MATPEELEATVNELKETLKAQEETNKGLKADLTKAKAELRKGQEINPAEFTQLQTDYEALKTKHDALDKDLKKVSGERDNLAKTLETEAKITSDMQRDSDLTNVLTSLNVTNPVNLKYAKALLSSQVQVVTENGTRVSKVGDKLLNDFAAEWVTTDEGKHVVSASDSSGGGAGGGKPNATTKTMTRAQFDGLDHSARASFSKDGGKIVD